MIHHLKIYPEHFSAVLTGVKRAELRKNDRDFKVGDILHLMETPKGSCLPTGEFINAVVTHIADVGEWLPGYVMLSIERESGYAAPQLPQPAVKVMSKDESRELFERHCYVNKERNKYHQEYYAHYPARQQWEIWEACREVMTNSEEIFKDMRKEFERWMVEEKKCIVGSSDPYPRGMEEDSWLAWKAAWNACRSAMLQGAEPVKPGLTLREGLAAIRNSGIAIDAEKIQAERDALNEPTCWCLTCRPVTMTDMRFVVCPKCGNKRCPHANDHRNACTGSNEPGQEGSAYPAAPQQEVTTDNTAQQFEALASEVICGKLPESFFGGKMFCAEHEVEMVAHPFKQLMSHPPKPAMYCPECEPSVAEWVELDKQLRAR